MCAMAAELDGTGWPMSTYRTTVRAMPGAAAGGTPGSLPPLGRAGR